MYFGNSCGKICERGLRIGSDRQIVDPSSIFGQRNYLQAFTIKI
jgi:hypothetical protein